MTWADSAWLHLEQPTNLMMVSGLLLLDRDPDHQRLERIVSERLLAYERFRCRAVEPDLGLGLPHWEVDSNFRLDEHLIYETLPGAGMDRVLERVSDLMSEALPRSRPLWELRVLEGLEEGAAVLARLHHSIADGIALMKVLLQVAEPLDGQTELLSEAAPDSLGLALTPRENPTNLWSKTRKAAHHMLQHGHDLVFQPTLVKQLAQRGKQAAVSLQRVLLLPPDSDNVLRGTLGVRKLAAVSGPLELSELKVATRRLGCTVNDMLMASLAGGLGRCLRRMQAVHQDLEVRAVVPVDLRQPEDLELGNRFGMVFLELPAGDPDAASRVRRVRQRMAELKGSTEALVTFDLLSAVGLLPVTLEQGIIEWFGNKATAVVTSLRGPDAPLFLGSARLTGLMYWVPQSGHLGLGVSMISYAGQVRVGVASDAGLLDSPQLLVEDFHAAYRETLSLEVL
jgi:WS/DGAT/MGAT family acyltransferase